MRRSAILRQPTVIAAAFFGSLVFGTAVSGDPPVATTVQLPSFGVAIDADGVLSLKTFEDPGGKLRADRLAAAKRQLPANVFTPAKLRKVSLVRLERAISARQAAGKPVDDVMLHLAGLTRVEYVFCLPDQKD